METALKMLTEKWGVEVANQIAGAAKVEYKAMSNDEFLSHCITCGGDWGSMLLSGIKELYPVVWELIPEFMGHYAFVCICCVMELCGVADE